MSDTSFTRRRLLISAGAGAGALAAGGALWSALGEDDAAPADVVLRAARGEVELGSRRARTMLYDDRLPGREIRLRQGRRTRIRVVNDLDEPTTVHWHGIRLENGADGVPGMTQKPIAPGESFDYVFTPPDAGTFMYHSHVGMQLDRGLYGALIVEPTREELAYDREAVLLLDDWLDGIAGDPEQKLAQLRKSGMEMGERSAGMEGMDMGGGSSGTPGMDMGGGSSGTPGMDMGGGSEALGPAARNGVHRRLDGTRPSPDDLAGLANVMEADASDTGDVRYPLFLVNGRPPEDPETIEVRRGDRLRLRIINPASDTVFCVFAENHTLRVTHADGLPVAPVETDGLLVGMGERYDVLIEARGEGVGRIMAMALGKNGRAVALLRYAGSAARPPAAGAAFKQPRRIVSYADLAPAEPLAAPSGARVVALPLGMRGTYTWTIAGQAFPDAKAVRIGRDELVRFEMRNETMMPHPMHLHGHSFRPVIGGRAAGPLKDTILVAPMRTTTIEWLADNPGTWAFHCHNIYHSEAGMMRRVEVA